VRPIKLSKKEWGSSVIATALALASLRPLDLWVFAPLIVVAWLAFLFLAKHHEGRKRNRVVFIVIVTLVLGFIADRQIRNIARRAEYSVVLKSLIKVYGVSDSGCTLTLDTAALASYRPTHMIVAACYQDDPTVDSAYNKLFAASSPRHIFGSRQSILIPWNTRLSRPPGFGTPKQSFSIEMLVFLIPNGADCGNATSISELARVCRALFTVPYKPLHGGQ
jgi:hypothetical protein